MVSLSKDFSRLSRFDVVLGPAVRTSLSRTRSQEQSNGKNSELAVVETGTREILYLYNILNLQLNDGILIFDNFYFDW